MRKVIGDILRSDPAIEVAGEAANGAEAIRQNAKLRPQVVTLDVEMPVMSGLKALKALVDSPHHPSVVMVSSYVQTGAEITLQCLAMGAADFVLKPFGSLSLDMEQVKDTLIKKVKDAAAVDATKVRTAIPLASKIWQYSKAGGVMVIGASTGGPAALEVLLPTFPKNFPYPVIVAQHLPKEFAVSLANRLDKQCQLRVVRAEQDMPLTPGTIYIAPGGAATTIHQTAAQPTLDVQIDVQNLETPSINLLMKSAARVYGQQAVGIILTGMGKDGAEGMADIKQAGGYTIVQDEPTSAVFGMGGEAVAHGAADAILPLGHILERASEQLA